MAQSLRYNEPFFWHRIVNVGWGGQYGILEITAPSGMTFQFGSFIAGGLLIGTFTKNDVTGAITPINLTAPILSNLYDIIDVFYLIGTVVFPDRVPPDPFAYETIKAGIHPPDRFREPVDLRTLDSNEFPFNISGWPTDGNWADPTFPWGTWSDGRPAYLPASSGSDPSAPGYYVNPNWGLGEAYQTSERSRDLKKYAWLLDFTSTAERIGSQTVELSIQEAGHDDDLGSFDMTLSFRFFPTSATFTPGAASVTASVSALLTQSKTVSYEQTGVIASLSRAGMV